MYYYLNVEWEKPACGPHGHRPAPAPHRSYVRRRGAHRLLTATWALAVVAPHRALHFYAGRSPRSAVSSQYATGREASCQ